MKSLFLSFVFTSSLLLSFAQLGTSFKSIESLISEGKFEKALKLIEAELVKDPNNYELNLLAGQDYYLMGDGKNSFSFLTKAIKINPNTFMAFYLRANLYLDLHMFEESKLDFETAYSLADNDSLKASGNIGLAAYYLHTRNYEKSVELLEKVLAFDSTDIGALNNIAVALEDLKRNDEAINYLKKVVALDPDFTPAYVNLGFQLSHLERYEEALQYFTKAQELNKEEPLIYSNRAFVYYKLKQLPEAMKDINYSLKLYESNSYGLKIRALIYLAMNENEKACTDLYKAKALDYKIEYGDEVDELLKENCLR